VKNRSWGWRQASTSSQLTGVETVGNWRARSEYGATVVLEPLFWLQSTRTLPVRSALVIRDTARRGCSRSSRSAYARARSLACSEVTPETGAYSCRPLPPEVLASGARPSASSMGRRSHATRQQSTTLAGAPGSRSKTSRSGSRTCGIRHIGTCSSRPARLAAQISAGRSSTTRYVTVGPRARELSESTRAVRIQSGRCAVTCFWKKASPSTPSG